MEQDDPIERLFARAKRHHVSMAAICREAGVAATTPSRWKTAKNGATIKTVTELDCALSRILSEAAARVAGAAADPARTAQDAAA